MRMWLTMALLGIVYLGFLAFLAYLGASTYILIGFAGLMMIVQFFFSDKLVLLLTGAKVVTEQQEPKLHTMVSRLCQMAGLPKPKIAVVNTEVPNAFATGRGPGSSVVAVTSGLIKTLTPSEMEGVLAHELSHIKHRDVAILTIASFVGTIAFFVMRWFMFSALYGGGYSGRGRRNDAAAITFLAFIVSAVVYIVSLLLIRLLSRYREYTADRGAALITGAPSQLVNALLKISGRMKKIPTKDLRTMEGMNQFFIIPALSGSSVLELFSTHPSVEKRVRRLEELERQMA